MTAEAGPTSPETEASQSLTSMRDDLSALARAFAGNPEETLALPKQVRIPEVGTFSWYQVAHYVQVRATQQREEGAPQGVEIACIFDLANSDLDQPLALSMLEENGFTVTVPAEDNTELHSYYSVTETPEGNFQARSISGDTLEADDAEAYARFASAMRGEILTAEPA